MITGISSLIYSQYQFLMPLHLEDVFQDTGAFKFGILTSINAFIVVIGTPVLTKKCRCIIDIKIMYLGQFFESFGLMFFIFFKSLFYYCYYRYGLIYNWRDSFSHIKHTISY